MTMTDIERVTPEQARTLVAKGALLVCAYEDEDKCNKLALPRAVSLAELRRRADTLPRDTPLILYCA